MKEGDRKKIRAYLYLLRIARDSVAQFCSASSKSSVLFYFSGLVGIISAVGWFHTGTPRTLKVVDTGHSFSALNCSGCSGLESGVFCGASSYPSIVQSLVLAANYLTYSQLPSGSFVPAYDWERMRDAAPTNSPDDEDEGNATVSVAIIALYLRARTAATSSAAIPASSPGNSTGDGKFSTANISGGNSAERRLAESTAMPRGLVSRLHEAAIAALSYFDRRSRLTRSGARFNAAGANGGHLGVQVVRRAPPSEERGGRGKGEAWVEWREVRA